VSLKERSLSQIDAEVRRCFEKESAEKAPWRKKIWWMARWLRMLQHEFIKDDVAIRAESLCFIWLF
jgi:hypothetical protein